MPVKICPHCGERYIVGFGVTDFVHKCSSGNLVIDQEDVVITGDWKDFDGEGTRPAQEVLRAGMDNEDKLTRRGVTLSTHRQRQHEEFINLKK